MDNFCLKYFYEIWSTTAVLSIGAIVTKCAMDIQAANRQHNELERAMQQSQALQMESLRPEQVKKRIKALRERMGR